jgi:hypothetical protein
VTAHDLALPRVVAALRGTAKAASLLPLLVGVLVLIGWAADVETLKRVIPGLTAMNPMTAVGFICLGCALALEIGAAARPRPALTAVFALIAVILGLSRIVALAGLWDLQLDWLLFREKVDVGDFGRPNRIAPNTAINFVLTGIALIVMDRGGGRFRTLAQMLALIAGITSLLALMGYAYGLRPFYGIGSQIAMALPTAVTFWSWRSASSARVRPTAS